MDTVNTKSEAGSGTQISGSFRGWRLAGSLLAGLLSLVFARAVFHGAYNTTDETSYLFQAQCFLEGVLARPMPPIPPMFEHYMLILREPYGWLSRYAPGHVLFLLPGVWLKMPRMMAAVAAALSVWFLTASARFLRIRPLVVLALLFFSPWFLLMHGTLLSHVSTHLALAVAIWSCLGWYSQRRPGYAVGCGLAFGFFFLTRNFTAMLVGTPFAVLAICDVLRERRRAVWVGWALAAAGVALGAGLFLLYNRLTSGDWLTPTYLVYDSSASLGFGRRYYELHSGLTHTWQRGWEMMLTRLGLLDRWLFGVSGGLIVILLLALAGWSLPWTPLLLGTAVVLWVGHIYFFSETVDNIGPYYYFESLPGLILAGALGVERLLARLPRRYAPLAAALALTVLVLACGWGLLREGRVLSRDLSYNGYVLRLLRQAPPDGLILLDHIKITPTGDEVAVNLHGLNSRPLQALYLRDDAALALAKCFPERTPYIMSQGREETLIPFDADRRLDIYLPADAFHGYTGSLEMPPDEAPRRTAKAGRDSPHWMGCRAYAWLSPGCYTVSFTYAARAVEADCPLTLSVQKNGSGIILAETTITGTHGLSTLDLELQVSEVLEVEALAHYGGSGEAELFSIHFSEH